MTTKVSEHSIDISGGTIITYNLPWRSRIIGFHQDGTSPTNVLVTETHDPSQESNLQERYFRFVKANDTFNEPVTSSAISGSMTDPVTSETTWYFLVEVAV